MWWTATAYSLTHWCSLCLETSSACTLALNFTYWRFRLQRCVSGSALWQFVNQVLSSFCWDDVEGLNRITSNLSKDDLLWRSPMNLSSRCSAIGPLPYFKVNPNGQNVYSFSPPSLAAGTWQRRQMVERTNLFPSNLAMRTLTMTEQPITALKQKETEMTSSKNMVEDIPSVTFLFKSSVTARAFTNNLKTVVYPLWYIGL